MHVDGDDDGWEEEKDKEGLFSDCPVYFSEAEYRQTKEKAAKPWYRKGPFEQREIVPKYRCPRFFVGALSDKIF